ncbi:MAG: hypothetical protein KGO53_01050 [Alphaproteobacteria bacterium]|nr:hypothetical protein [Alphaproteobacteria bacterium]
MEIPVLRGAFANYRGAQNEDAQPSLELRRSYVLAGLMNDWRNRVLRVALLTACGVKAQVLPGSRQFERIFKIELKAHLLACDHDCMSLQNWRDDHD